MLKPRATDNHRHAVEDGGPFFSRPACKSFARPTEMLTLSDSNSARRQKNGAITFVGDFCRFRSAIFCCSCFIDSARQLYRADNLVRRLNWNQMHRHTIWTVPAVAFRCSSWRHRFRALAFILALFH